MNVIQHQLIETEDQKFLTVVINGEFKPPVSNEHPNFDEIWAEVQKLHDEEVTYYVGDQDQFCEDYEQELEELSELFDISLTIAQKFDKLSERVSVANGHVYFDGDVMNGTIVETILRFLDENQPDYLPLVHYIEKIAANPEPHSREQLYDWLKLHDTISITPEGDLIAYKGVSSDGKGGYQSGFTGTATVDGVTHHGHIPNYVGAEVTMPRSQVAHDPSVACHTGLHVGTFDYAKGYAYDGAMLAVRVNPRDVVSVPTDAGGAKIRVCRYVVEEIIETPHEGVLVDAYSDEKDSDGSADVVLAAESKTEVQVGWVVKGYDTGEPFWDGAVVTDVDDCLIHAKIGGLRGAWSVSEQSHYFAPPEAAEKPVVGDHVWYRNLGDNDHWKGVVTHDSGDRLAVDTYDGNTNVGFYYNESSFQRGEIVKIDPKLPVAVGDRIEYPSLRWAGTVTNVDNFDRGNINVTWDHTGRAGVACFAPSRFNESITVKSRT